MVGVFLSGTGNTKHCIQKFLTALDSDARCIPIEEKKSIDAIRKNEEIVLAYPTQFSNVPFMVEILSFGIRMSGKGKRYF